MTPLPALQAKGLQEADPPRSLWIKSLLNDLIEVRHPKGPLMGPCTTCMVVNERGRRERSDVVRTPIRPAAPATCAAGPGHSP